MSNKKDTSATAENTLPPKEEVDFKALYEKSQAELAEAKASVKEAFDVISEQEKALANVVPASEAKSHIVSHKKARYAFRYPSFKLDGKDTKSTDATPAQIARLVEIGSAVLRKIK